MTRKFNMKVSFFPKQPVSQAFAIIEALIVMAILVVLVALLLPATSNPVAPMSKLAQIEIAQIVGAIQQYQAVYGRYPVPTNVQIVASANKVDFTCGGPALNAFLEPGSATPLNADIMAILLDRTNYPSGKPTANNNHNLNPQKIVFLNARFNDNTNAPGIGPDLVYRDPWGHPYIISLDLNRDNRCRDAFYKSHLVSRKNGALGFCGLTNISDASRTNDLFEYEGGVMVWSFGPDGKVDKSRPAIDAPNKDNVLSWD
jgi:type II secretory pathway pseudopilin PulG